MGQESKNQVLTVRKVQVPVQKTLQEDTEMIWRCQHLGQVWRIQLIPASLGPGQHGPDLAHGLQRWLKTATFLPLSCVGQSAGTGREIILPEETTARRGSPSWAQGTFLLAAWSGMLRSRLGCWAIQGGTGTDNQSLFPTDTSIPGTKFSFLLFRTVPFAPEAGN